ncbi:porin [Methylibium sp. Root1272]|uniref:porin n=1 Tax=Methylibium sp. Root1272 TaxID=1736441 RepID=UPI0009E7483B|nr:porin [Methylibium sp. Root1272]
MKKFHKGSLVISLGALLTAGGACAQSSNVTLYGIVDAGVEVSSQGNGTHTRLISGGLFGSRWGLKGTEDLGGGLSALFRLESGFSLDDGTLGQGGRLFGREAVVGLSSSTAGTLLAGRVINTQYIALSIVDTYFYGTGGGLLALTRSGATTQQLMPLTVNARADNALSYTSPNFGGLEFRGQIAAREASTTIGRYYGLSARYKSGNIDFVASHAKQEGANDENGSIRSTIIGGSYNFTVAKVYAGYANEKNSCTTCTGALARATGVAGASASEFQFVNVGVRVPFGQFTAIAQAVRITDDTIYAVPTESRDATALSVGGEYALSKRTILYGSAATVKNKNGSQYAIGTGAAQQPAGTVAAGDPRSKAFTLGVAHFF